MASSNVTKEAVQQTRAYAFRSHPRMVARPDEVLQIPSREDGRLIRIHAYNTLKHDSPTPVLINWHGSGFVIPLHGIDDEFCQTIVRETDYIVLDCSYRLAPENTWPAAVHDVEDVIKWVLARPDKFLASNISLSGFSAGASLTLIASSQLFPHETFRSAIAIYPATNLSQDASSKVAPDMSRVSLPPEAMDLFTNCYLPNPEDRKSPLASPYFTPVEMFADRMFIATGACDLLCPEAEALAHAIKDQTSKFVELHRFDGCEHAWDKTYEEGSHQEEAKDKLYKLIVAFLLNKK